MPILDSLPTTYEYESVEAETEDTLEMALHLLRYLEGQLLEQHPENYQAIDRFKAIINDLEELVDVVHP